MADQRVLRSTTLPSVRPQTHESQAENERRYRAKVAEQMAALDARVRGLETALREATDRITVLEGP